LPYRSTAYVPTSALHDALPISHDRVADVFVERAVLLEDDAGHFLQVEVEHVGEPLDVERFGEGGEVRQVREHDGHLAALAVQGRSEEHTSELHSPDHLVGGLQL